MVFVNPSAVAVEPAAHGVQERLQIAPHVMLDERSNSRRKGSRIPDRARHMARVQFRRMPVHLAYQKLTQPRQKSSSMTAPVPWLKPSQINPSRFSSDIAV